jgi:hypothetical protein
VLLADKGYDPTMGARPLRRAIQRLVEDPLSERLLWKEFRAGETIIVDVGIDPEMVRAPRIDRADLWSSDVRRPPSPRSTRARRGSWCSAGCQVEVDVVDVVTDEPGRGTVEVDGRARRRGGRPPRRASTSCARRPRSKPPAGRSTSRSTSDDGAVLVAASPFGSPAELREVLDEISGPDGPYADLGLRVDRSFARTEYRFEGVLDGSVGIDAFADPGVAAALDGSPSGSISTSSRPSWELRSDRWSLG